MSPPAFSRGPFSEGQINRIVEMAWEDRTSFEAIRMQFGLSPGEVIKLMRKELQPNSFRLWRRRTTGRRTKHEALYPRSNSTISSSSRGIKLATADAEMNAENLRKAVSGSASLAAVRVLCHVS